MRSHPGAHQSEGEINQMAVSSSTTADAGGFANDYRAGNEADFNRLYETSYGKILGTLTAMLGEPLLGAFLAVRRSDADWAADRPLDDVVAVHRWRY